jgi:hypothetical protein
MPTPVLTIPTITYQGVMDLVTTLVGVDAPEVTPNMLAQRLTLFNRWIRRGWEWQWWPGLGTIEERFYRDQWAAPTTYLAGAQVYFSNFAEPYVPGMIRGYWQANTAPNTPTAGQDPGNYPQCWTQIWVHDAFIPWTQNLMTPIGGVRAVLHHNPRCHHRRHELPFWLDERGVTLSGREVPPSVWLDYRYRCPKWSGATFSSIATYTVGQTMYYTSATPGFEGDYYTCAVNTTANQTPETNPASWAVIAIPAFLADFVAAGIFAELIAADGARADRAAAIAAAWEHLYDEQSKYEGQSGQGARARVVSAY